MEIFYRDFKKGRKRLLLQLTEPNIINSPPNVLNLSLLPDTPDVAIRHDGLKLIAKEASEHSRF